MNIYIKTICLLFLVTLLTSCSDWLEVDPRDKTLEDKQFSTKTGVQSVLNGLYIEMTTNNLYGGKLAMTDIEHLGHYYYAPSNIMTNTNYRPFHDLQNYKYDEPDIESRFSTIWEDAYRLILRTNVFIKRVKESTVIDDQSRDLMLGEAYTMRAFLHFDLFRLFGPVYSEGADKLSIPYNDQSELTVYPNISPVDFMTKVLEDITTAKLLLKDDPILEHGVLQSDDASIATLPAEQRFDLCLRNRRFNLFAARQLETRALFYIGEQSLAAQRASEILLDNKTKTEEETIFEWVEHSKVKENANYVLQSEVVFGLESNELYSRWQTYTESTEPHSVYGMHGNNLFRNLFSASIIGTYAGNDVRFAQWKLSDVKDVYVSIKYKKSNISSTNLIYNLQALMRKSELYYIIAEEALGRNDLIAAAKNLNMVLKNRGLKDLELLSETTPPAKSALETVLEQEYYREFVAEGQVFFFHKRRKDAKIYSTHSTGYINISALPEPSSGSVYVVPLPLKETNS